jgi:hypothetical protein
MSHLFGKLNSLSFFDGRLLQRVLQLRGLAIEGANVHMPVVGLGRREGGT